MAKFRNSKVVDLPFPSAASALGEEQNQLLDRPIGQILREKVHLSAEEVDAVLAHMRNTGLRFGDAAVALGLATNDDVMQALAEQFGYPCATEDQIGRAHV